MTKTPLLAAILLGTSALAGAALGQAIEAGTLDIAKIRAEAAKHASEAETLSQAVHKRADDQRHDALMVETQARTNGARYVETVKAMPSRDTGKRFDFDRLIVDANTAERASLFESPRFIAFASLSMPATSLKALLADVPKAGGVVVFRGFPEGGMKRFAQMLTTAIGSREAAGSAGIDPRLFRAFEVDAVPAYVIVSSDFDLCDGFDCQTAVPPHDRMSGNVTAQFALQTFAQGGGPGARIAALHLEQLEKAKP